MEEEQEQRNRFPLLNATYPSRRGWEFYYLHSLLTSGHQNWSGPTIYAVNSVAFSLDGRRIVGGGGYGITQQTTGLIRGPGELKVWDSRTGRMTLTLRGNTSWVESVVYSPDGRLIVSGSVDGTLKVWDAQTAKVLQTLKMSVGPVSCMAFRPDGRRIVIIGGPGPLYSLTVLDMDMETRRLKLALTLKGYKGHRGRVRSVAYSLDGRRIVSCDENRTLKVWDAQSGEVKLTLRGHTLGRSDNFVNSVAFSPDGKWIVSGSSDKTLIIWDAQDGKRTLTLRGHTDAVRSVAFSPDGRRIVSGSDDKTLKVWEAEHGQETLTLRGHTGSVRSVAFSPDGRWIASGSKDGIKLWDSGRKWPAK